MGGNLFWATIAEVLMQLITYQRLTIDSHCENRFPLDAFWGMGIYSGAKTTGFVDWAPIQFSHRWVSWESICVAVGIYPAQRGGKTRPPADRCRSERLESSRGGQPGFDTERLVFCSLARRIARHLTTRRLINPFNSQKVTPTVLLGGFCRSFNRVPTPYAAGI
ncbi:hypothetical protein Pan181_26320 [Aeoliella mucimassa]|uniref:Uncharacterized protein n=1 Tax=Aeoliella mucimassa TaxID=2527972 RepID=A0A518ANX2_9BACT|nr:hypothetical protein Pan181_26320 [Aeoliella mucimassa]